MSAGIRMAAAVLAASILSVSGGGMQAQEKTTIVLGTATPGGDARRGGETLMRLRSEHGVVRPSDGRGVTRRRAAP